jgi:hypothetical protein
MKLRDLVALTVFTSALAAPLWGHTRAGLVILYPAKDAVYLQADSLGASGESARLDDGRYVFQVTEPSGKALLSTDAASCRQFDVAGGAIAGVVSTGCEHLTRFDADREATAVQLMPFSGAKNRGGMYKAWIVKVHDFLSSCAALGVADGLSVVNCGFDGENAHGFTVAQSRSYLFKVRR